MNQTLRATYESMKRLVDTFELEEVNFDYPEPQLEDVRNPARTIAPTIGKRPTTRLPSRLVSPLIPLCSGARDYLNSHSSSSAYGLNQECVTGLYQLRSTLLENYARQLSTPATFDVDYESFHAICETIGLTLEIELSAELQHNKQICQKYALDSTRVDIQAAAVCEEEPLINGIDLPKVPAVLDVFTRLRAISSRSYDSSNVAVFSYTDKTEKYSIKGLKSGALVIEDNRPCKDWLVMILDRYSMVYHSSHGKLLVVPTPMIDYWVSRVEILFNMEIMAACPDYHHLGELFEVIKYLGQDAYNYNNIVTFMKSFEGFMNMTADFKASSCCTIGPYLDCLEEMIRISNDISPHNVTLDLCLRLLYHGPTSEAELSLVGESKLIMLIDAIKDFTPIELLEASSLHKSFFYALVNEESGIRKFIKRTHTPRQIDPDAISQMKSVFNKTYVLNYHTRHKQLPGILYKRAHIDGTVRELNHIELHRLKSKVTDLTIMINQTNKSELRAKPLDWWVDLVPFDCEDKLDVGTPIEHAKDKRACKEVITHSIQDSEKELESIIRSAKIPDYTIPATIIGKQVPQRFVAMNQHVAPYTPKYPVRLAKKEKEQKVEGRDFGMNTTWGKQYISKYMNRAKHVLSYFPGNLMTPSDKLRKQTLHEMAQDLLDPEMYCIMADVEGHNQSMQPENTATLLQSVGLCFGEFDWAKLSYYFANLHVFYPKQHEDTCFVSKGQLGGIEGWYNPVWTLHTLLVTELIKPLTEIDIIEKAVYSDDIAMSVRLTSGSPEVQNNTLVVIQQHYFRFGMILKLLQTMISKYRITMLRQHYIKGVRADSAPKRILATTTISNSMFHADSIETMGLNASVNSALELSNHVIPQTLMKWYRYYQLNLRSFQSSIETPITPVIMNDRFFTQATVALYNDFRPVNLTVTPSWIFSDMRAHIEQVGAERALQGFYEQFKEPKIVGMSQTRRRQFQANLAERMIEDEAIWVLFHVHAILPGSFGGSGLMSLEQMVLTGMSDNTARSIACLFQMFQYNRAHEQLVSNLIRSVLGLNLSERTQEMLDEELELASRITDDQNQVKAYGTFYSESALLSQEWPSPSNLSNPDMIISSLVKKHVRSICRNPELSKLFILDDAEQLIKPKMMDELRDAFSYKVASFYASHTASYILRKILAKIESTSSLIRNVKGFNKLCHRLSALSVEGPRIMLQKRHIDFGPLSIDHPIQEYLFNRRSAMYPRVNFLPVIEPEVNSFLKRSDDFRFFIKTARTRGMENKGGKERHLAPLFGSEALYKGDLSDPDSSFESIREYLAIKVLSVSKWIIFRSNPKNFLHNMETTTNISNLANMCLSSLGYGSFITLHSHVRLVNRSEVLHRIPILDAKPGAAVRCLPALTKLHSTQLNNADIAQLDLKDSNIHFDYWRLRTITASAIKQSCNMGVDFITDWKLDGSYLIASVELNFVKERPNIDLHSWRMLNTMGDMKVNPTRIKWLAMNLEEISTGKMTSIGPNDVKLPDIDESIEQLMKEFSLSRLQQLQKSGVWDATPGWGSRYWDTFYREYEEELKVLKLTNSRELCNRIQKWALEDLEEFRYTHGVTQDSESVKVLKGEFLRSRQPDYKVVEDLKSHLIAFARPDTDQTDEELIKVMKLELQNSEQLVKSALEILLGREFVNTCIIVNVVNSRFYIDVSQTKNLMARFVENCSAFISGDAKLTYLIQFMTRTLNHEAARSCLSRVIEEFSNYSEEANWLESESIDIPSKPIDSYPITSLPSEAEKAATYSTSYETITGNTFKKRLVINKLLNLRKSSAELLSHPDIFYSPTGSDVFMTMKSILNSLKIKKYLTKESFVIDAIAGRGDTALALTWAKIPFKSFGRLDHYTCMRRFVKVSIEESYDISDPISRQPMTVSMMEALSEKENHKVDRVLVIVDLSFSVDNSRLSDDLCGFCVNSGADVLIRIQSGQSNMPWLEERLSNEESGVSFLRIGEGNAQSPYVYALITDNQTRYKYFGLQRDTDQFLAGTLRAIKELRETGQIVYKHVIHSYNSVTEKYTGTGNILDNIHKATLYAGDLTTQHRNASLITSLDLYKFIPVNKSLIDRSKGELSQDMTESMDWSTFEGLRGIYLTEKEVENDKLRNKFTDCFKVDLYKLNDKQLSYLMRYHPHSQTRLFIRKLRRVLSGLGVDLHGHDYHSFNELVSKDLKPMLPLRSLTKIMINAAVLLTYDVLNNSANASSRLYQFITRNSPSSCGEMAQTMHCRKLLQSCYDKYRDYVFDRGGVQSIALSVMAWINNRFTRTLRIEAGDGLKAQREEDQFSKLDTGEPIDLAEFIETFIDLDKIVPLSGFQIGAEGGGFLDIDKMMARMRGSQDKAIAFTAEDIQIQEPTGKAKHVDELISAAAEEAIAATPWANTGITDELKDYYAIYAEDAFYDDDF